MTTSDIKRFGLILAKQAEIEGMIAENKQREITGEAMAYNADDFMKASADLMNVVHAPDCLL